MITYRRLNIQHKMKEANLTKDHLLNLKIYKHREEMFNRKVDRLRKSVEHLQPYIDNDTNDQQTSTTPIYNKSSKQITNHLPLIRSRTNSKDENNFQTFLNQQILNEYKNQLKYDERKAILLKEFDELKHTINDPHSTLSVLAALSRALLYLDSGKK
ncbi:unnamed protein product [Adineta steineri]|uniref:Uncharacterized protein n=1 Tax=Adineta steineri TaxID=433720 RepID=A0A819T5C1_9BILA|nr:unnamed protein product [Adineta steineri]